MKIQNLQVAVVAGLLMVGGLGCRKGSKDANKVVASVAGEKITQGQFREMVKIMAGDDKKAEELLTGAAEKEQRNQLLEHITFSKAAIRYAKAQGVDKDPKAKMMMEQAQSRIYLQVLMDRRASKVEPTEAQLKGLYDELVAERKAAGQDQGIPPYDQVKAQMPAIWKQKQEQNASKSVMEEVRQKYPATFADEYKPAAQPGK